MSVIVKPDEDQNAVSNVLAETIKSGKLGRNLSVDPAYLVVQQLIQDDEDNAIFTEDGVFNKIILAYIFLQLVIGTEPF